MSRSVAFLRGINVGGRRVTNDQLVAAVTSVGFADVETFLASGNVIFGEGPAPAAEVMSDALASALGFAVPVTVRAYDELAQLAGDHPFEGDAVSAAVGKAQVILLFHDLDPAGRQAVLDRSRDDDLLVPRTHAVHWLPAAGVSGSGLTPRELDQLVGPNTVRTATTIQRLLAKL